MAIRKRGIQQKDAKLIASIFQSVITPALVASVFTLLFNVRSEKRKQIRDDLTKSFDEARSLVEKSVSSAAAYYSKDAKSRTSELEATLWLYEREMRFCLSRLIEKSDVDLAYQLSAIQHNFDSFISELTGGTFQDANATADLRHVRKIAGIGAELRHDLSRLRHAELVSILRRDLLDRLYQYFTAQGGIGKNEQF